jgi:plasmid maintenance system killer protein
MTCRAGTLAATSRDVIGPGVMSGGGVRVEYGDEVFRRLVYDGAFRSNTWRPEIISSYRRRHQSLVAAKDREDLRQVTCLGLRPENGRGGTWFSIRLVDEARLMLDFIAPETDKVTVLGIVEANTREVAL